MELTPLSVQRHPHGKITYTPTKNSTPAAFNPSTNLPASTIFRHHSILAVRHILQYVTRLADTKGNAPRPWGIQPNTSPWRLSAATCAFLRSCLKCILYHFPLACRTSIRTRHIRISLQQSSSHLAKQPYRSNRRNTSANEPPAHERIQTPPVCGNDV